MADRAPGMSSIAVTPMAAIKCRRPPRPSYRKWAAPTTRRARCLYIENEVLPIAAVSLNGGQGTRLSYGAWELPGAAAGQTLNLTDISGRTVSVQVAGGDGQNVMTGKQFPACAP
jgi:hypothetical protein